MTAFDRTFPPDKAFLWCLLQANLQHMRRSRYWVLLARVLCTRRLWFYLDCLFTVYNTSLWTQRLEFSGMMSDPFTCLLLHPLPPSLPLSLSLSLSLSVCEPDGEVGTARSYIMQSVTVDVLRFAFILCKEHCKGRPSCIKQVAALNVGVGCFQFGSSRRSPKPSGQESGEVPSYETQQ